MFMGGNSKLKKFFDQYKMPKEVKPDYKYRTLAGYYYRDMVKSSIISNNLSWPAK